MVSGALLMVMVYGILLRYSLFGGYNRTTVQCTSAFSLPLPAVAPLVRLRPHRPITR